ncbi:MAG: response regulator [Proteobacteria bacterium]|nr:response regulator [Pseudomonadota bacterium]
MSPITPDAIKPKIMILDDEVEIGELLEMFLCDNFDVVTFNDPRVAKDAMNHSDFDIILSDIKMPHISGIEFLKLAKQQKPNVPVVLMTGHAQSDQDRKHVVELGALGILAKPFGEPKKLIEYFEKVVADTRLSTATKLQSNKILAIDDEVELLEILGIVLDGEFEIDCISNPSLVIDKLSKESYLAIFCDLNMPKISGVELIKQMKPLVGDCPIFVMSGHSSSDPDVIAAISAGAVDVIAKPFPEGSEISTLIRKHVK